MTATRISKEQRVTLEEEYKTSYQYFNSTNVLAWQTFSYVSALNVAALAFVSQVKFIGGNRFSWLGAATVGVALSVILIAWIYMANRWWAYGQVAIRRMIEIEGLIGMHMMTDGGWLRQPLDKSQLDSLSIEQRARYEAIQKAFPKFPKYGLRQQVLASYIVRSLILIWIAYLILSYFGVI